MNDRDDKIKSGMMIAIHADIEILNSGETLTTKYAGSMALMPTKQL